MDSLKKILHTWQWLPRVCTLQLYQYGLCALWLTYLLVRVTYFRNDVIVVSLVLSAFFWKITLYNLRSQTIMNRDPAVEIVNFGNRKSLNHLRPIQPTFDLPAIIVAVNGRRYVFPVSHSKRYCLYSVQPDNNPISHHAWTASQNDQQRLAVCAFPLHTVSLAGLALFCCTKRFSSLWKT